ncbi:OXA mitochondrial inner membrane insertase-like protein [Aphelenchoides fujianensis]|nr:OXA mitochondrial inner membrane insertase-like protein [Aphelenchoides fujianensis]
MIISLVSDPKCPPEERNVGHTDRELRSASSRRPAARKPNSAAGGAAECVSVRFLSINDVFGRVDLNKVPGLPDVPTPPLPRPSLDELVGSGQSVLEELGLWTWWKPSSWFRWGMESMHIYFDLPWWSTIVIGTVILRLALIKVTVMSQKSMAIQSRYKPELDKFRARITDARAEANNQLVQQILMEQNDFLRSKDIRTGRQLLVMLANGGVFMTNFFAIRKMAKLNYPGWENGGALWFTNLTACDPYYVLPAISAATLFAVVRVGWTRGRAATS